METVLEDFDDYGDLMTMEDFVETCKSRCFINYDGFGKYATSTKVSNHTIRPSDVITGRLLHGFTHVVWYNR